MNGARAHLPPLQPECRLTVCIPARNEAAVIGSALDALTRQRDREGRPLAPRCFDVVVLANNCSDLTAEVARRFGRQTDSFRIAVIETAFSDEEAHIGSARKFVMDLAAQRFIAAGVPDGIVASIDSDTIADACWVDAIRDEIGGCDAVAGHVTIARADHERLLAPPRLLYARELTYRRILAEVEALIDPVPEDPAPRHSSFVGASFAVTAASYLAAGGIPALPRLEDQAFARALHRIDARIRHSLRVRATTSARRTPRVVGGFGSFIAELHDRALRGTSFTVEHPLRSMENFELRATLRRIRRGAALPGDLEGIATMLNLAPEQWLPELARHDALGAAYERITQRAELTRRAYADVTVDVAIEMLRRSANGARATTFVDDDGELLESVHAG